MTQSIHGYGFQPNFSTSYSVTLPYPIEQVFTVLGTSAGHESVCRLSALCTEVKLGIADTVQIPDKGKESIKEVNVRTMPSPNSDSNSGSGSDTRALRRQAFTMTETIPIIFGLLKKDVNLKGTLSWDEEAKIALYETETMSGVYVQVWKLRMFEEVEDGKTKVSERIEGVSPKLLKDLVHKEAQKGHVAHMNSYHTLFA